MCTIYLLWITHTLLRATTLTQSKKPLPVPPLQTLKKHLVFAAPPVYFRELDPKLMISSMKQMIKRMKIIGLFIVYTRLMRKFWHNLILREI